MSAGIIDEDASLDQHLEHIVHTWALLLADPNAQPLGGTFEALLEQWWQIDKQETLLWIAILKAAAQIVVADNRLDALADELSNTLLAETNNDRTASLYTLYFGNKRPYALKRPVLSGQLETQRGWIPSLKGSHIASVKAIGDKVEAAVKVADAAVSALAEAKRNNREFRMVGERRKFVDSHNAARKSTHGALAEIPHKHPELGLPNSFADRFFKRVSARRARDDGKPPTAAELAVKIAELESEVDALKKQHEELLLAEQTAAEAQAQRQAEDAAIEAAEREAEEALAKVAALRAKRDS